jgi:hypothetical protein
MAPRVSLPARLPTGTPLPPSPAWSVSSADYAPEQIEANIAELQALVQPRGAGGLAPWRHEGLPALQPEGPVQPGPVDPAQAGAPSDRAAVYLDAQRRLAAGEKMADVERALHLGPRSLRNLLNPDGRVLIVGGAELLRHGNSAALDALPRALRPIDLAAVVGVLRQQAGQPVRELPDAAARAGIPAEVIEHLFDEHGVREDQVQALPRGQRNAIRRVLAAPSGEAGAAPAGAGRAIRPHVPRPAPAMTPEHLAALLQAQQLLVQHGSVRRAATSVNLPAPSLSETFTREGRLLVTRQARALLSLADAAQREPFEALSRALRPSDVSRLEEFLPATVGAPPAGLQAQAALAGIPKDVREFLFDDNGLREDRLAALPANQSNALRVALGQPPLEAPPEPERVVARRAVRQATRDRADAMTLAAQLLAQGVAMDQVAQRVGFAPANVARTLTKDGRLLIGREGEFLLRLPDDGLRARFEALPHALGHSDLTILTDVFRTHLEAPGRSLRQAAQGAGVSPHAVWYLFEGEALREDRLARLPEDQQSALRQPGERPAPTLGATRFIRPWRVEAMREAQQLLAGGMPFREVAERLMLTPRDLNGTFDRSGRLRIGLEGERLLRLPDLALRAHFESLPRTLRDHDVTLLCAVLRQNAQQPFPDLGEAAHSRGVGQHALDYLFEGGVLREDHLATLPEVQMRALLAARAGVPEEAAPRPPLARGPRPRATATLQAPLTQPPVDRPPRAPQRTRPPLAPQGTRPAAAAAAGRGTQMPGAAEITAVLRFFRDQPGVLAFGQAQRRFSLDGERLLQWLAQAGVSEREARLGAIPGPAVLWARISPSGAQPPQAASPSDMDSFAASLQALLESPAPHRDPTQATSRKRAAEQPLQGEPDPARARLGIGQDTAWAGIERRPRAPRTARAEGPWGSMPPMGGPAAPAARRDEPAGFDEGLADPGPLTLDVLAYLEQPHRPEQHDDALDLSNLPSPGERPSPSSGR